MKEKLLKIKQFVGKSIRKSYEVPLWKWIIICFVMSIIEVVLLEMLGRRSLLSPFVFIIHNPLVTLYNILIVFFTLSIALLFKRRGFVMGLILMLWLAVGTINFVLQGNRITPFSAIDFLMVSDVLSMFNIYFNLPQRIGIFAALIIFIILLVVAFLKIPKIKGKVNYIEGSVVVLVSFVLVYIMTVLALESSMISDKFTNLNTAYKSYGFAYCFANSVIDQGISKPDNYSMEEITKIEDDISDIKVPHRVYPYKNNQKQLPNIIVIQLESFIDIGRVNGVHTDIESIPNFKKLQEDYPSGFLNVPAIGAGTANTEFEIITGMKSKSFGAGEYPYKTVLTTTPCESMAQLLLRQGYGTHAIHNNKAKFYSRDESYASLGFQTFTSLEYMLHFERTRTGWAKDNCLPEEIFKAIDCDEEPDFVFTISVQGHGKYPKTELKTEEHVKVTLDSEDPELTYQFGYFVNQCYEMDQMIGELKKMLDEREEDYVLLLYGDHIPNLTFEEGQFNSGTESQTEYVIVSSFDLGLEDKDMYTYEMSDYLLRALDLGPGVMQDIHDEYYDSKHPDLNMAYDSKAVLMQYDMLYGDRYIYNYIEPYERYPMKLGIYDITVDSAVYNEVNGLTVKGENFTEFSKILINDDRQDTLYVDENTLMIISDNMGDIEAGDEICVAQIDKNKHELSRSNSITYY